MKNTFLLVCSASILFACSNPTEKTSTESAVPSDSINQMNASTTVVDSGATTSNNGSMSSPGLPGTVLTGGNQPTAAGMNPPHGQPGHRCEIAVGAPLSSAPAVSAAPTITSTPTPIVPASAPTVTAPGMNPPHGEPGHDCAIAVGAPLKK